MSLDELFEEYCTAKEDLRKAFVARSAIEKQVEETGNRVRDTWAAFNDEQSKRQDASQGVS